MITGPFLRTLYHVAELYQWEDHGWNIGVDNRRFPPRLVACTMKSSVHGEAVPLSQYLTLQTTNTPVADAERSTN